MRNLDNIFKNRNIINEKLLAYGFIKNANDYIYEQNISNNHFKVIINLNETNKYSKVIDLYLNEEYLLVDVHSVTGEFVGKIKDEYDKILNDIVQSCSVPYVFGSKSSKKVIQYINDKYHDELEYLWPKFPSNAIWRNKTNNKWYGILMVISKTKLGINKEEEIEIIDLRYPQEKITEIIDNKNIFAGYHMNKNHWITIILDNNTDLNLVYKLIDISVNLSLNSK